MFLELAQAASAYWAPALFVLEFSLNTLEPAVKPTHLCRESGPCVSIFGTDAPETSVFYLLMVLWVPQHPPPLTFPLSGIFSCF